jgi:hypothetical protein
MTRLLATCRLRVSQKLNVSGHMSHNSSTYFLNKESHHGQRSRISFQSFYNEHIQGAAEETHVFRMASTQQGGGWGISAPCW